MSSRRCAGGYLGIVEATVTQLAVFPTGEPR